MNDKEKYMRLAITKAKEGIDKGQSPFGACIVRNNEIIACEHNIVWENIDITAHAEIHAIREACKKLNSIELRNCEIYSTCEPCPMCFTAIHWAKISKIIYGAGIKDAKKYGFNELTVSNKMLKEMGCANMEIEGDILKKENIKLFEYWKEKFGDKIY